LILDHQLIYHALLSHDDSDYTTGVSEKDIAAFRKASVSVGVISDKRLQPKIDCQHLIEFKNLSEFIRHLAEAEFVFSEDLLTEGK
jgi:hypothetical protein